MGKSCLATLAAMALATMSSGVSLAGTPPTGDGGVSTFYTWAQPLPSQPGRLLRAEPLPMAQVLPEAASGERLLYTSTEGVTGKGIVAVSGTYYTPKGKPPAEGWPLIAWAHGTVGMADVCAPSWAGRSARDIAYLDSWLKAGFAVVATDYQGLGTPGPHPYLLTRPEAYGVLDGVRAVQRRPGLSGKVIVVGQSQGAGAALATAALARRYAPGVDLRATVATGTPNLSVERLATASNGDQDRVDPALAYVYYVTLAAQQQRPQLNAADVFTAKGLPLYNGAASACVVPLFQAIIAAKLTRRDALKPDAIIPAFGWLAPQLAYAGLKLKGPLFMGIGAQDKDANPEGQLALAVDACKAGTTVEAHLYEGLDHNGTVNGSFGDSLPFVRRALAGERIKLVCKPSPQSIASAW